MVIFGESSPQFSWIEYQALMLCLAGVICTSLFFVEIALNRFQVLPLLFPGMFSVKDRRFYFFNFDISDGVLGKKIRAEAKMACRMTICLVLSYLWQHCVLETTQQVGTEFPKDECLKGADCFASTLHFVTLLSRQYEAIDCKSEAEFEKRVVVSCIRFIPPTATTWLMHLAISHSVTQLNFKAFEILVWVGGNSKWARRLIGGLIVGSLSTFVGLFFAGFWTEFVSSWLAFVMSLVIPWFLYTVYKSSKHLQLLWKIEAVKVQRMLELNLNTAFVDIEYAANLDVQRHSVSQSTAGCKTEGGRKVEPGAMKGILSSISRVSNFVKRKGSLRSRCDSGDESDGQKGLSAAIAANAPEAEPLAPVEVVGEEAGPKREESSRSKKSEQPPQPPDAATAATAATSI